MKEKIMLIDGNSIINRAFYALPVLTNKNGEYTNAVLGFLNIFFKLYDEEKPDYIAVAFDLPAPTFRHEKFQAYKGTRKSMPEELRPQIPLLKNLLELMNIALVEKEGYEADDMLGTMARQSEENGLAAVIVSGDRDLLQTATESILVRIPKTKGGRTEVENYYAADVAEKIGVTPKEYIDVKALMGDASDNIPGVPGIGEKTAVKIIQEYKSLSNAILHAGDIKPKKAGENLMEYREQAILSRELAEINLFAPYDFNKENLKADNLFTPSALEEYKRLELRSLLSRFKDMADKEPSPGHLKQKVNWTRLQTRREGESFLDGLSAEKTVAYDLTRNGREITGAAFCQAAGQAVFISLSEEISREDFYALLKLFFEAPWGKIGMDAKKDMASLSAMGISYGHLAFDVMIGAYILHSTRETYDLEGIAMDFLKETLASQEDRPSQLSLMEMDGEPEEDNGEIACRRAEVIWRASCLMAEEIEKNGQKELYYGIELPLIPVLADMEERGIKIDGGELKAYGNKLQIAIDQLTAQIHAIVGREFNINSPKQLGEILFDEMGLKGGKKTKTGWSTAADVLEKLKEKDETGVIGLILDYRSHTKLKSTYVDGLLALADGNFRIHTTFNQTVASTGRLSSTEPNLQNIPVRTELGRELRRVFIPQEGFVLVDADYSQIELRLLAHMSGDETFIQAFRDGEDIHKITAAQVFHTPLAQVSPRQRSSAKAVNFGIVYGIGAFSLSEDIGVSVKEAGEYIEQYFNKYPRVKSFMDKAVESAKEKGYSETLYGRRRALPEIRSSNFNIRSFGERAAMNMPVQGSAADIIKIAMIKVFNRFKAEALASRLILTVHDELLVEAEQREWERVKEIMKEEMEGAAKLSVPLSVDIHTGANWYEAK